MNDPIDMVLHCPYCITQHIDAPEGPDWTNPPHKSHLCHSCKTVWRPADVPTNGVVSVKTRGSADNWPPFRVADHYDGYVEAFYRMASALGMSTARNKSPKEVFEQEMFPKIAALTRAAAETNASS